MKIAHQTGEDTTADRTRTWPITVTRTLGAVALLAAGGIHYQQYHYAYFSRIPTIGPLFLLNSLAAAGLGLFLLSPVRPSLGRRGKLLDRSAALAGIGVATGALAALLISEHAFLFGFMEHGYRFVIVFAIGSETASIVMLTLYVICARNRGRAGSRANFAGDLDGLTGGRQLHLETFQPLEA